MKNPFLFNKNTKNNNPLDYQDVDHYKELAKLVKEARIQQNLTIEELSSISKIPVRTITCMPINTEENLSVAERW